MVNFMLDIRRIILYLLKYLKGLGANLTVGVDKEIVAKEFKEWFANRLIFNVIVFLDGLETEDGLEYRYVIYEG